MATPVKPQCREINWRETVPVSTVDKFKKASRRTETFWNDPVMMEQKCATCVTALRFSFLKHQFLRGDSSKGRLRAVNATFPNGILPFGQFLGNDSSHNFAKLGDEFFEAAKVLYEKYGNDPKWPTYFLAFHSLELYLKSYLLRKGKPLRWAEKEIGHNIRRATEEAKKIGLILQVDPKLEQAVMKLSDVYRKRDFQYRRMGEWEMVFTDSVLSFVDAVRAASVN